MAVYKVPQDVEADDKLIGPFSFRQFIYLIIVAGAILIAWMLSQVFVGLAILPLPIILLFGALALPLKKDQPMETYLAAIISFYLKPRKRLWDPDGQQALVEITAPKVVEVQRTKGLSDEEAERRLSYLANVVDTHGWAVRGVTSAPDLNTSMNSDLYYEAQQAEDVLDTSTRTAHNINSQLDQRNAAYHQQLMQSMQQPLPTQEPTQQLQPLQSPQTTVLTPVVQQQTQVTPKATTSQQDDTSASPISFNPYPTMQQNVIQPLAGSPSQSTNTPSQQTTSDNSPSPDIINLANNADLSIETIAHEANRIKQKQSLPDDEVMISLH